MPFLDMSRDVDVEADHYVQLIKDQEADQWFHDFMIIALIKYKRLQGLMVERQKAEVRWTNFLMGSHHRVGEESCVQQLRGKQPVIELLQKLVVGDLDVRMDQLEEQIIKMLTDVNNRNPYIIPGVIDRNSIPPVTTPNFEDSEEEDFEEEDYENVGFDEHRDDTHDATSWPYGNHPYDHYRHAWHMSRAYIRVLQLFLDIGKVNIRWSPNLPRVPVEGFLRAAFDYDPSVSFGKHEDVFTRQDIFES